MLMLLSVLCALIWFLVLFYCIERYRFYALLIWLFIGPVAANLVSTPGRNPFFPSPRAEDYVERGPCDTCGYKSQETTIKLRELVEPTRLLFSAFFIIFILDAVLKKQGLVSLDKTEIYMGVFALVLLANILLMSNRLAYGLRVATDAFIIPFLAYFVTRRLVASRASLHKLIRVVCYMGSYIIVIGLIERMTHSNLFYRLSGPFKGETNALYVTMAVVFFMALVDMLWSRNTPEQRGALPRGVRRFVLCLAPVIIVLNLTRGDWLGFLVGMGVFLFLGRQLLPLSWKVGVMGVTLVLIPVMCICVYMLAPEGIYERRVGRTATIYSRLGAWQLIILESVKAPILGHGLNNARDFLDSTRIRMGDVKSETHVHNSFLAFLFELGIVGLFAYLAIAASIVQMGLKLYRKAPLSQDRWLGVAVVTIIVAYFVPANFGTTLYITVISHIYVYGFLGGIAGLYHWQVASELQALPGQAWRPKVGTPAEV